MKDHKSWKLYNEEKKNAKQVVQEGQKTKIWLERAGKMLQRDYLGNRARRRIWQKVKGEERAPKTSVLRATQGLYKDVVKLQ